MTRVLVALALALTLAACDSQEPEFELPSRGQFQATLQGDLDRDLEGDAVVTSFPGFDGAIFTMVSLMSRARGDDVGRSVSVSGVIPEPGVYPLGQTDPDALTVTYADGLFDLEDTWSAVSGVLRVARIAEDGVDGSIEAVLERIDLETGRTTGQTTLEATFQAVEFRFEDPGSSEAGAGPPNP